MKELIAALYFHHIVTTHANATGHWLSWLIHSVYILINTQSTHQLPVLLTYKRFENVFKMFRIQQNSIIPMISIEYNGNMVGLFQDEQKFVIHWGLKEVVMTKDEALDLCSKIKALAEWQATSSPSS